MAPADSTRTAPCGRTEARTRLEQAEAHVWVAELVLDGDDATDAGVAASQAVLGGIAASDAACCARLGRRPRGQRHLDAVGVLASVEPGGTAMSKDLQRLLAAKDNAHYGTHLVSPAEAKRLVGYARRLLDRAAAAVEA